MLLRAVRFDGFTVYCAVNGGKNNTFLLFFLLLLSPSSSPFSFSPSAAPSSPQFRLHAIAKSLENPEINRKKQKCEKKSVT